MTNSAIDDSQRKAARVEGITLLFAIAIVVFANYGIIFRLIVPGNAADTARNIMAHETLFRINIACNLKADEVLDLLARAGVELSRHELSAFFRAADHKHYRACKDEVLMSFLRALQPNKPGFDFAGVGE